MRTMTRNSEQQIVVLAKYSDGSIQDVTRSALFEANEKELAKTTDGGRVQVLDNPGDVAVMVRYQARSAVFRATVPLGAPLQTFQSPTTSSMSWSSKSSKPSACPLSAMRRCHLSAPHRDRHAGRLPAAAEAKQFHSDTNLDKRAHWIDTLLSSSDYADNFANKWTALLRNKRGEPAHKRELAFHSWIRDSFAENKLTINSSAIFSLPPETSSTTRLWPGIARSTT